MRERRGFILFLWLLPVFLLLSSFQSKPHPPQSIVFYNWRNFTNHEILQEFEQKTGVKVILKEFDTQSELISELQSHPERYDVVVSGDQLTPVFRKMKLIRKIDFRKVPNISKILPEFGLGLFYPGEPDLAEYAVPYDWGTVGLAMDSGLLNSSGRFSWDYLLDSELKDRTAMMDDPLEVTSVAFFLCGMEPGKKYENRKNDLMQKIGQLKENGVRLLPVIQIAEEIRKGNLYAGQMFNCTFYNQKVNLPGIQFVLPREGYTVWVDHYSLSVDCRNIEAAHAFLNFILSPKISAKFCMDRFVAPVVDCSSYIDPERLMNQDVFPPMEVYLKGVFSPSSRPYQQLSEEIFHHFSRSKNEAKP